MATGLCGTCGGSTPGCGCALSAGSGIAITGDGSLGSPFEVTATVGRVTAGSRISVSGAGSVASPYVVTADAQVPVAGDGIAVSGSTVTAKNRLQLANPFSNASGAVWQRGTTYTPASGTFAADRYVNYYRSDIVWSRQASGDTQGSGYCIRVQRPNANAVTTATGIAQSCLSNDSVRFAGRQCTFSMRMRKGSGASVTLTGLSAYTGTGTDQSVGSGLTGSASYAISPPTLTTAWQTVSVTFTAGASVNQVAMFLTLGWAGTAGASDYFEYKDVRLDEGPNVVEHVQLSYVQDLADCQRFFYRLGSVASAEIIGLGQATSATNVRFVHRHPVPMRANATLTVSNVVKFTANDGSVANATSAVALDGGVNQSLTAAVVSFTSSGLTTGRAVSMYTVDTAGYLDFSAEI